MSSGTRIVLSADGETAEVPVRGPLRLSLSGNFGGGTAQLVNIDPAGNDVSVIGGAFTAATEYLFDFPPNAKNLVKISLSGSSSPALVCWFQHT